MHMSALLTHAYSQTHDRTHRGPHVIREVHMDHIKACAAGREQGTEEAERRMEDRREGGRQECQCGERRGEGEGERAR